MAQFALAFCEAFLGIDAVDHWQGAVPSEGLFEQQSIA